jgi:hypothetical protein
MRTFVIILGLIFSTKRQASVNIYTFTGILLQVGWVNAS